MPGTKEGAAKRLAKTKTAPKDEAQKRLEAKFGGRPQRQVAVPTHYVVGHRPLSWEGLLLQPGEEVPGAADWPRLEAWTRAKRVVPAYGERMTSTETVEAGEPEDLPEFEADEPEDDDPTEHTGEPLEDEEEPA